MLIFVQMVYLRVSLLYSWSKAVLEGVYPRLYKRCVCEAYMEGVYIYIYIYMCVWIGGGGCWLGWQRTIVI
jgi:hypothetical protein